MTESDCTDFGDFFPGFLPFETFGDVLEFFFVVHVVQRTRTQFREVRNVRGAFDARTRSLL